MKVITVKFADGGKNYDYLLLNPDNFHLNMSKPLRHCIGCGPSGMTYQIMKIVQVKKVTALPTWVTSQITMTGLNEVAMQRIPKSKLQISKPSKKSKTSQKNETSYSYTRMKFNSWDEWVQWRKQVHQNFKE